MLIVGKIIDITTLFFKQSSYLIGQHRMKTKEMFHSLKGNAKVLLVSEPCWSIPVVWIATYIPLYMLENGLSKVQIGFVVTISLIAQLIALITGGYFADRWGRKKTVMLFDTLCWIPGWLILIFSKNILFFSIFYFIWGFSWVVAPAWYCLFIEGTKEYDRPALFAFLSIIFIGAGIFVPLAGIFVEVFELVNGFKVMCLISIVTFFIGLFFRWKNVKETEIGNILITEKAGHSFEHDIKDFREAFIFIFTRRELMLFMVIQSLSFLIGVVMTTYVPIYLVDKSGINLSASSISLFPFIFSISTVLVMLTVIPYIAKEKLEKYLVFGTVLSLFGYIIFISAPKSGIVFIGLAYFLFAAGNAFFRPLSDTYGANIVTDRERAKVTTIFTLFYTIFSLPAAPLAGLLYKYSPQLPFMLIIPLQLIMVFLTLRLTKKLT